MRGSRALLLSGILGLSLSASATAQSGRAHLLLVTVDTLRADNLSAYGAREGATPNLDKLGKLGVLFEDAISVIGKTGPSFATTFTSLYPPTHGARRNSVRLRSDVPVLAEILRGAGYTTAAFISNWTLKDRLSGLGRGFDHYDEEFNTERNSFGLMERDAVDVTRSAVRWLSSQTSESDNPLFVWVHYSEPHDPYNLHLKHIPPEPTQEDRVSGWKKRHRYASEVSFTDHWIGELFEGTKDLLPESRTYVAFLSDHGESLGEHGYWGHGKNVHWPNLQVPLILKGPSIPKSVRLTHAASLTDVLPTLLELLHLDAPTGIVGRSLVPTWTQAPDPDHQRFAIGDRGAAVTSRGRNHYQNPRAISLQTEKVKVVFEFEKRSLQYYDLVSDPNELRPLGSPPVEVRPPLGRQLSDWYRDLPKYEHRSGDLRDEDVQQLKALGYID